MRDPAYENRVCERTGCGAVYRTSVAQRHSYRARLCGSCYRGYRKWIEAYMRGRDRSWWVPEEG